MSAGIYCRISKAKKNAEDSVDTLGVERQESMCRELATRLGLDVSDVYVDNNLSGKAGVHRPEFERLKTDIIAGTISDVLVWKTDRLSRDRLAIQLFYGLLKDHSANLHTDQEGSINLETPDGALMAGIRAEMSQYERAVTAERVKAQKKQRAHAGTLAGGKTRLYGYADKQRTALHPDESKIVKSIFDDFLAGKTIAGITNKLIASGAVHVTGSPIRAYHVKRILKNGNYAGMRVFHGELVAEGTWPKIIDRQTFDRAQAKLATRDAANRSNGRKYLLTSILYCDICKARLVGGVSKIGPVYRCEAPANGGCGRLSRNAEKIDAQVLKLVAEAIEKLPAKPAKPVDTSELDALTGDMALLQQAHADGDLPTAVFIEQYKAMNERKTALTKVSVSAAVSVATTKEKFLKDDTDGQREVVRAFFPAIGVKPAGKGIRFSLEQLVFE
ncbi:hypothetical protein GCM10007304_30350 [Rhodococcoides trifolii]|uniref:Recombinase family protein n=1 Tax=Rhodococcoides trifolii TaxID=908250 RepID=A0A917FYH9_9NOCA|nr:recombinase family protein [Rhodococcus trifolii]GGG14180.1 hypothetical protein GCM10007304_30350 [Rhodococcus trifolii]